MKSAKGHDERRRELILTARALFSKHGVEHTSISQIVGELDIAHGLFYYYFKSKEEVMEAVVETMLEDFERGLVQRMNETGNDFCAGLICFINTVFDSFPKPAIDFHPKDLIMSRYHDRLLSALHEAILSLWAKGVEQGILLQQHSELAFQIIMSGSLFMIEKKKITRDKVIEVIAQILNLPQEAAHKLIRLSRIQTTT